MQNPQPLGVGVIGLANMGQKHIRGVAEAKCAKVVAVADLDTQLGENVASRTEAVAYESAEALIEDPAVQAVSICLPHSFHHPVACAAIAAGKHVLLEKPMAVTVAECDDLISRARDANVELSVQHNQVFDPVYIRARQLIQKGALGTVAFIRLRLGLGRTFGGWRTDFARSGGGILFDAGLHRIYIARYLLGDGEVASSVLDVPWDEGEELAVVVLKFAGGAVGVIEANFHGPDHSFDDSVEIVGTSGALLLQGLEQSDHGNPTPATSPLRSWTGDRWHDELIEHDFNSTIAASVAAFCNALTENSSPPVSAWDGREAVRLARDAYEAATFVGRTVTLARDEVAPAG